jgi:phosphatidylglycerol:prolipoprotein diacylglycerol transferase
VGQLTGEYLILTGMARFLVEFIRINPRVLWGMSNAQLASLGAMVFGFALILAARARAGSIAAKGERRAAAAHS